MFLRHCSMMTIKYLERDDTALLSSILKRMKKPIFSRELNIMSHPASAHMRKTKKHFNKLKKVYAGNSLRDIKNLMMSLKEEYLRKTKIVLKEVLKCGLIDYFYR